MKERPKKYRTYFGGLSNISPYHEENEGVSIKKKIETKKLVEFVGEWLVPNSNLQREYKLEIMARLQHYDKLKEGIEELSNLEE